MLSFVSSEAVEFKLVKLESSSTVILPPKVTVSKQTNFLLGTSGVPGLADGQHEDPLAPQPRSDVQHPVRFARKNISQRRNILAYPSLLIHSQNYYCTTFIIEKIENISGSRGSSGQAVRMI